MQYPTITLTGVAARMSTRTTASGTPMVEMDVAVNPRRREADGTWAEDVTQWWRVKCWGALARHAHATLTKGALVTVSGTVRGWESTRPDGSTARGVEVAAHDVAVSLRTQTGTFARPARDGHGDGAEGGADAGRGAPQPAAPAEERPAPEGGAEPPAPASAQESERSGDGDAAG